MSPEEIKYYRDLSDRMRQRARSALGVPAPSRQGLNTVQDQDLRSILDINKPTRPVYGQNINDRSGAPVPQPEPLPYRKGSIMAGHPLAPPVDRYTDPRNPEVQALPEFARPQIDQRRAAVPQFEGKVPPGRGLMDAILGAGIPSQVTAAAGSMQNPPTRQSYDEARAEIDKHISKNNKEVAKRTTDKLKPYLEGEQLGNLDYFIKMKGKESEEKGIKPEWWALIAAGFATMAAPAGSSAMQAFGQGGLAGMQAYDMYKKHQRIKAREKLDEALAIAQLGGQMTGVDAYLKAFKDGNEEAMAIALKNMKPRTNPRTPTGKEVILSKIDELLIMKRNAKTKEEKAMIQQHINYAEKAITTVDWMSRFTNPDNIDNIPGFDPENPDTPARDYSPAFDTTGT